MITDLSLRIYQQIDDIYVFTWIVRIWAVTKLDVSADPTNCLLGVDLRDGTLVYINRVNLTANSV